MKNENRNFEILTTLLLILTPVVQATPALADSINITAHPQVVILTGYFESVNSRGGGFLEPVITQT